MVANFVFLLPVSAMNLMVDLLKGGMVGRGFVYFLF